MNGLADNCPACLTLERAVTCYPVLVVQLYGESIRATYRCECGHRWETSWLDPEIAAAVSGAEDDAA